jgi:hypothetical protein
MQMGYGIAFSEFYVFGLNFHVLMVMPVGIVGPATGFGSCFEPFPEIQVSLIQKSFKCFPSDGFEAV